MSTCTVETPASEVFVLPASFAQQRLWLANQLHPGDPALNMAVAIRFRGRLDIGAVQASLKGIVERHEVLRTRYAVQNGEIVQLISPIGTIDLPVVQLDESVSAEQLCARASGMAREGFDLARGPVLRAELIQISPEHFVLVIVVHHIAADGWSMMVLVREFTELYTSLFEGRPTSLPRMAVQYGDYAHWQERCFAAGKFHDDVIYWKDQLAGLCPLDLPTDYIRPPVQRHVGARETIELSPELSAQLVELASREQTTLFIVLLTALQTLLYRYTGVGDIAVGSPVAGRKRVELNHLVGCFLNTVVIRTQVAPQASFLELLGRVRENALKAYSHDDAPFEKVLEEVNPARALSHTPLFQVFLNMLKTPDPINLSLPEVTAEIIPLPETTAKFDFTLYVDDRPKGLHLSLVYNTELFSKERMQGTLEQFEHLLKQIVTNPHHSVSQYSLVTPAAQRVLPDPLEKLDARWEGAMHELFEHQAARNPSQLAVCDSHVQWSYRKLDILSNKLAHYLLSKNLRTGDVVAIYGHRSASLVLALLAVMKAGAAFLILDPAYPTKRLLDYLELARPHTWLQLEAAGVVPAAIDDFLSKLTSARINIPSGSDAVIKTLEEFSAEAPHVPLTAESLAYISFTSGSTGKPKGVLGGHGSLTHFVPWMVDTFAFNSSDRFSLFSALSHDPLHRDVFTPLMIGATVCIPPADDWRVPEKAREWILKNGITVSHLTPAMGKLLTADRNKAAQSLVSLRRIFFVGEALTHQDVNQIYELAPYATCINYFGATETQRAVSFFRVPPATNPEPGESWPRPKDIVPLGHGIQDVQLLVLNQERCLAGIGEIGEIYVRSPHIALGYLGDPQLSAEKFLHNSMSSQPHDRMYRTGDLGRYLPGGAVETLGRNDTQVKIRGFRIELGEIEAILKQQAQVLAARVISRNDSSGSQELVAYVVLDAEDAGWNQRLIRCLSERLPDYMVPASFVSLKEMPLTANGKIDIQALPSPIASDSQQISFAPTLSLEEELLTGIFAAVLNKSRVAPDGNFFEMGGHSLLATQVIARIRDSFAIDLPLRSLFETPTVAKLAQRIREMHDRQLIPNLAPSPASQREHPPLSYAQQRLWTMHQLEPENPEYNMFVALRLIGNLDREALCWSLQEIVQRHAVLRTSFVSTVTGPQQIIADRIDLDFPQTDLRSGRAENRDAELMKHARQLAGMPFDLTRSPLLRAQLLQFGEQEHVLLLAMHHIISDGWSMAVLAREMRLLYEGRRRGEQEILPDLKVQYSDYAVWQRKWLEGEILEKQLCYWRDQMKDAPAELILPGENKQSQRAPQVATGTGEQPIRVDGKIVATLRDFGREANATLFMTLLAAWQTVLYRHSAQTDMVLGIDVAGRRITDLEPLIGFFVNQLPLRTNLAGEPTFRELLNRVRTACLGAYAHQDVSFERIVEELNPRRQFGQIPWMKCKLVYMNVPREPMTSEGLTIEPLSFGVNPARFDLTLFAAEQNDELVITLQYRQDRFSRSTMEQLSRELDQLLSEIAQNPDLPIKREAAAEKAGSGRLSEAERVRLIQEWNRTDQEYGPEQQVQELFEQQVVDAGASIAVICNGEQLSYEALNLRANQLARYLRKHGVEAETRVGLYMEQSVEMVVSMLAVLKAGGVYIPLDPAYPEARLNYIVHDSRAALVIVGGQVNADRLGLNASKLVLLAAVKGELETEVGGNLGRTGARGNLAYVLYTSGSTGRPKGVMVSHGGVLNYLKWCCKAYSIRKGGCTPVHSPLGFDLTVTSLIGPLVSGGAVELIERQTGVEGLTQALRPGSDYTLVKVTPSHLELLMRSLENQPIEGRVRALVIGGEALRPEIVRWWQKAAPQTRLINEYGPTETVVGCCTYQVEAAEEEWRDAVPIGRPIANTQLYVLDQEMEPVAIGQSGELYIGGAGVARGYWDKPELTAERFVPNPFGGNGERLYRTGDWALWRGSGQLEYLGREDEQVKLRGYRIELGEIENTLREHSELREVAVILAGEGARQTLVAYVVRRGGSQLGNCELRDWTRQRLPEHMVPGRWIWMDQLPLTAHGKLDRSNLATPAEEPDQGESPQVSDASGEMEQIIANIWKEALLTTRIGLDDKFFDIGGNSMLLIECHLKIQQAFHAQIPVVEMFNNPTVRTLARYLQATQSQILPKTDDARLQRRKQAAHRHGAARLVAQTTNR
jgi:amino acid adenylation domain-containing protein